MGLVRYTPIWIKPPTSKYTGSGYPGLGGQKKKKKKKKNTPPQMVGGSMHSHRRMLGIAAPR